MQCHAIETDPLPVGNAQQVTAIRIDMYVGESSRAPRRTSDLRR